MILEKVCKGPCKRKLSIDQYHWKCKRKGHRQNRCKDCMAAYGRLHYVANMQEYKDRANSRLKPLRANNHELLTTYLSTHPCSKCGESNHKVLGTNLTSGEINNLATVDLSLKLEDSVVLCRNCEASKD